jgi:hypothetical protein
MSKEAIENNNVETQLFVVGPMQQLISTKAVFHYRVQDVTDYCWE